MLPTKIAAPPTRLHERPAVSASAPTAIRLSREVDMASPKWLRNNRRQVENPARTRRGNRDDALYKTTASRFKRQARRDRVERARLFPRLDGPGPGDTWRRPAEGRPHRDRPLVLSGRSGVASRGLDAGLPDPDAKPDRASRRISPADRRR